MADFFKKTMTEAYNYLSGEGFNFAGELFSEPGYMAVINTNDRSYTLILRIDESTSKAIFEVYPGICCEDPYRNQTSAYMSNVNTTFKDGNFRVGKNGTVLITSSTSFSDDAISAETFKDIVDLLMFISDIYEKPIDKIAHGILLSPEEYNVDAVMDAHRARHSNPPGNADSLPFTLDDFLDDDNDDGNQE